jgi:tRNA-2-methylthio-N6-dimethylallyladenosine synthase
VNGEGDGGVLRQNANKVLYMRFFIKSYGCQMNSYDSVRMADCLTAAGYSPAETSEDADILIFNTCSIREKADEKLFSDLGKAKLQKLQTRESGKDCIIIVTGCVAQAKSSELLRRAPYVNAVIGPQNIHEIVEAVKTGNSKSTILTGQNAKNKFPNLATEFSRRGCSEFLTIQEGCDNFCTYCVVPYTRGREVSRDVSEITEEAEKLVAIGVKEITLLGRSGV